MNFLNYHLVTPLFEFRLRACAAWHCLVCGDPPYVWFSDSQFEYVHAWCIFLSSQCSVHMTYGIWIIFDIWLAGIYMIYSKHLPSRAALGQPSAAKTTPPPMEQKVLGISKDPGTAHHTKQECRGADSRFPKRPIINTPRGRNVSKLMRT